MSEKKKTSTMTALPMVSLASVGAKAWRKVRAVGAVPMTANSPRNQLRLPSRSRASGTHNSICNVTPIPGAEWKVE